MKPNTDKMYKLGIASILAMLVLGSVACAHAQPGADVEGPSIVELASSTPDLQFFLDAVIRADLVEALSDPSTTYTVFAPTNEAFEKFLANASGLDFGVATVDDIDTDTLTKLLTYHVIPVAALSTDLTDGRVLETLDVPETLSVDFSNGVEIGNFKIVGSISNATVIASDKLAGNSIVHVVDEVLVPAVDSPNIVLEGAFMGDKLFAVDFFDWSDTDTLTTGCALNYATKFVSRSLTESKTWKGLSIGQNIQAPLGAIRPTVKADGAIARPGRNEGPQTIVGSACGKIRNAREIKGKYCLVNTTGCGYRRKFQNCKAAGAVGAIAISEDNTVTSFNVPGIDPDFPFVMVFKSLGDIFIKDIGKPLGRGGFREITLGKDIGSARCSVP